MSRHTRARLGVLVAGALLAAAARAPAQTSGATAPALTSGATASAQTSGVFRGETELVTLQVAVVNPYGRYVAHLNAEDFAVFEQAARHRCGRRSCIPLSRRL